MNKIKSLLRNFKARLTLRIVSFFKAPYKYLADKVYDHIQEDMTNILENTNRYTDLEYKVDDKLNTEDFDYELCNAYSFSELQEKVDTLEANNDLDHAIIGEESHPISQLIDERNEQIHSLILEVKGRLDKQSDKDSIADLAIKIVDGFRLAGLCPLDDGEDETHFEYQDIIRTHLETYLHSNG